MNILITGAGGFVGRNLSEFLRTRYKVFSAKKQELNLLDFKAVEEYIKSNKINFIIHCAASGGARTTNYDNDNFDVVDNNIRMFFNLERCLTPEMRMIHFGSGAEYDRPNWCHKMPEDYFDKNVPQDSYGYAKYIISKYIDKTDNITCFRILGLFGKYEDYRYKFISNAIIKNLLKMQIIINQNVFFDYLYIKDFLNIIDYFILNKPKHKHYNITPTNSIDLVSIAEIINQISSFKSEIIVKNPGLNNEYSGDNSRLLSDLTNFEFTSYKDAISELYNYYKVHLHHMDIDAVKQDHFLKYCIAKK